MTQETPSAVPSEYEAAVARGAAWLDENHAGWWMEIDLARLDLGSLDNCVIGQLGIVEAVPGGYDPELGFDLYPPIDFGLYPALTATWRKVIEARQ